LQQDAQPVIGAFRGAEHPTRRRLHHVAMLLHPGFKITALPRGAARSGRL
jgi:hypothetical protein